MYKNFEELCKEKGVKPVEVSRETGVSTATLSSWKTGRYIPKTDKLQKIADYFGVPLERLTHVDASDGAERVYYFTPETAAVAQEIFENRNMRILFDAAKGSRPEDLQMAADLLARLKGDNID